MNNMFFSGLKNIFKINTPKLPRRNLTVDSTNILRSTIVSVLNEMLKESCPCHYPRFRELTTFLHDNYNAGGVYCADTNYLIGRATDKELNFLKEIKRVREGAIGDFDDIIYSCNKCSTIYRVVTRQYSINFEFSYFIIENNGFGIDVGQKVIKPIPLLQGLFAFDDKNILKCSNDFILTDSSEFYKYLTMTAGE